MQELIEKESVLEILEKRTKNYDTIESTIVKVKALPTTVHQEYMDWKKYEFSYDWHEWHKWIFAWYQANYWTEAIRYSYIRPLQSEHPDIIQARELLEKSWYSVTKI